MINWTLLKDELKLKTGYAEYNSNKTELICKCPKPECELHSKKNKGHLYIKVDDNSPVFNCFKCGFKGILPKLLNYLGLDEDKIIQGTLFRDFKKEMKSTFHLGNNNLFFENIEDCEINFKEKVKYLKDRLGNMDLNLIPNLVLNINNFIRINNINTTQISPDFLEFLNRNFIGFVTNRNTLMVLRNIDRFSDFRYYNMKLVDTKLLLKDFYGIKTKFYNEKDINTIVLCEGIFDLLVSYFSEHFEDVKEYSMFWAAVLNNRYDSTAFSVLEYCKLTKANFIILSDNTEKESNYLSLSYKPFVNKLDIYWNKKGKDFGELNIEKIKTSFNKDFIKGVRKRHG